MTELSPAPRWRVCLWLVIFAAAGVAMAMLYPDSYQQDGGHHYLFARFAWKHPELFVGVWARPLFTLLYSFPAQLGYQAAKLLTVAVCLVTAHQTYRLAEQLKLERAHLVVPLLFLEPSYFLLCADTMTEPLFALVFIIALRLHLAGRVLVGMIVASLMILARPEGFFLGVLWGVWVLFDRRDGRRWWRRIPSTSLLSSGAIAWWLAALLITRDPLFIRRNWPPDWGATKAAYGIGTLSAYLDKMQEFAGPYLYAPFLFGLLLLLLRRRLGTVASAFLTLFILHSVFRWYGLFGSAGYARYFVCVSPAIALITLVGWNAAAKLLSSVPRFVTLPTAAGVLAVSAIASVSYVDAWGYIRDARAVAEMYSWFHTNQRPVRRLIWSQAHMCILLDRDVWEKPAFSDNKEANLDLLRQSPEGTLIFWDGETGPSWYGIKADDLAAAGYQRLRSQSYKLDGWLKRRWWYHDGGPRRQEMHLFYKAPCGAGC